MRSWRALGWIAVAIGAAALILGGILQIRVDTTTRGLLPASDPSQVATQEVAKSFGGDPIVALIESHDAAGLLAADQLRRVVSLEAALSRLPDVAVVYGPGTLLNQIAIQARDLMATISGRRDGLKTAAEADAKAKGLNASQTQQAVDAALAPFDQRYGALIVKALPAGLPTLSNAKFVQTVVFDGNGEPRNQWRFVVPSPTSIAIVVRPRDQLDQAQNARLVAGVRKAVAAAGLQGTRATVAGTPVLTSSMANLIAREIPLLGACGFLLVAAVYFLMPWLRPKRRRLMPLLATLLATGTVLSAFGWFHYSVTLGVVAFLPIALGIGSDFPAYLVRGVSRGKVFVVGAAAAAGFASLAITSVPFVRDLGLALGLGVLASTAFGFLLARLSGATPETDDSDSDDVVTGALRGRRGVIAIAALAFAAVGWVGLASLPIVAQPDALAAGLPTLKDAARVEGALNSSGEVDLLVRADDVTSPATLAWMRSAQTVLVEKFADRLHPILSPPSMLAFLGSDPSATEIQAGLAQLPGYLRTAVIRDDGREALLSFGAGVSDANQFQELMRQVAGALPPRPPGVRADFAGIPVVAARSFALVSGDRYVDAMSGIAVAGAVLLFGGRRRRRLAACAVLAAALATGWGFAGAWILGISLSPLTVGLGSLATATACEFTMLFASGHGRAKARPVFVAATAAASGYLTLTLSQLNLIRDFGLFLAAAVGLSLVAAYLVNLFMVAPTPPGANSAAQPLSRRVELV